MATAAVEIASLQKHLKVNVASAIVEGKLEIENFSKQEIVAFCNLFENSSVTAGSRGYCGNQGFRINVP